MRHVCQPAHAVAQPRAGLPFPSGFLTHRISGTAAGLMIEVVVWFEARSSDSAVLPARFGSVVSAWLPDLLDRPGNGLAAPSSIYLGEQVAGSRKPTHVLLVEDDPAIAEMYRVQLEYDGYEVTVESTGERGSAAMGNGRPDLVLLDLLLPDRSGLEIMAEINERFPNHPPIVILSNYGEPSMIDRGFSLGALDYLVKSRVTPALVSRSIPGWIEQAGRGGSEPRS
jgi:CheY-like chemotaxis protein